MCGPSALTVSKIKPPSAMAVGCLALCLMLPLNCLAAGTAWPQKAQTGAVDIIAAEEHHPVERPLSAAMNQALVRRGKLHSRMIDGRMLWWLDSESPPNGRQDPSDLIFETRLVAGRQQPFVTCATCHDPVPDRAGGCIASGEPRGRTVSCLPSALAGGQRGRESRGRSSQASGVGGRAFWRPGLLLWAAAVPARGQALDAARHVLSGDGSEPCIFCHTPSGGEAGNAQPIWARNVTLGTAFGTFDTMADQGGQSEAGPTAPVTSVACLSCHDGTQAPEISARIVRSAVDWSPTVPSGRGGRRPTTRTAFGLCSA